MDINITKIKEYLPITQIIISSLLIVLVLLQQRGTGLGSLFGGQSGFYSTRRGLQKKIFWLTGITVICFIAVAIFNLFV
ncbi:preprotein translocase subunit SecG [Patescibacteria group bacterium]|nr:preprotein translocase subunit SecG [Patescibacteria group bacterium]MBU1876753.1 preprotein translocase subunit SecG [Patescibacteria group bacterium]